jgi:hypothetical protein
MGNAVNLIWQVDPNSSNDWESDWICSLLTGFEIKSVVDTRYEVYIDKSIIVSSGSFLSD